MDLESASSLGAVLAWMGSLAAALALWGFALRHRDRVHELRVHVHRRVRLPRGRAKPDGD